MSPLAPDAFVYRSDLSADEIPAERISPKELGLPERDRSAEYTRVPLSSYKLFPPHSRLILCLIFARDVFGEDAPGGWNKLGSGLAGRFGLEDRYVRRRAVAALERHNVVEVLRRKGATTLLRFTKGRK
jgi:hypothetical protein